jgi:asparaginyl-tRNA synthetase
MDEYYLKDVQNSEKKQILLLQELILTKSVEFYSKRGIHWLSAPITTGTISSPMGLGSDSQPVKILLDGRDTYLADSMQFLLEYGCRFFENGCWYIMPTFRGEPVDKRHLKQFFHSEAEIPGTLLDVMDLADEYLKFLMTEIQKKFGARKHLTVLIENKIPRIAFDEAVQILNNEDIEVHKTWRNITTTGEQKLIKHFNGPVWVMNYDEITVPFYQRSIGGKAQNADLLLGIGETVGCGERWKNGDEVLSALERHQVSPKEYDWYAKMKQEFPLQTAGFGMGIERFLLFVLEKDDIREIQVFRRFNDGKDIV